MKSFENIKWCADDNEDENESDGSDVEESGDDTEGEIHLVVIGEIL